MASFSSIFADVTKQGTKLQTSEYLGNGKYPIIDQGQDIVAGYTDREDGLFTDVPVIVFGDHTRIVKYVVTPFFLGADGVKVLKGIREDTDSRYLYYAVSSIRIPNTGYNRHFKWLKEADIIIPDLPTQRRIATTLNKVSEGIALCKQMMVDLDDLVKSQFVEMFGDPVKNERAWAMKPIKDLYSVGSSKRIYAAEQTTVGVPFLRVSDICSLIDGDNVQPSLYISEDKFAELESNDLVPTANDILVTSRGTIGRCYIIKASDKFYFQDGMVTWLKQKGFDIEPIYVSTLFAANSFSELLDKATNKTTVHYISIDKLAAIPIPVPPIELQKQFTAFVEQADKSKLAVQQQLAELETLKKSLMQEYFG